MSLTAAGFKCAKKVIELKAQYQEYRKAKIQADFLESIALVNKKLVSDYIQEESEKINNEYLHAFVKEDSQNERIERIKNSVRNLSKFFESGGEVHPSLIAPSELQSILPDYNLIGRTNKPSDLLMEGENPVNEKENKPNAPSDKPDTRKNKKRDGE